MASDLLLPITALVVSRTKELGLSQTEVVRRAGYTNISKGLRRLDELCRGNFRSTQSLLLALPCVLEISSAVLRLAVVATQRHLRHVEETAYRSSFVSHAIILTDRASPEPIFVAAIVGVGELIRINFDLTKDPTTFVEQALRGVREKVAKGRCGRILAFGRPTGIVVNYSPDHAVEFDLKGNQLRVLDRAHRPGTASLSIKGRAALLTRGDLSTITGNRRVDFGC